MWLRLFPFFLALPAWSAPPSPVLQKYAGTWQVSRKSAAAKEELKNQCASAGSFYVCQQSNNGAVSGLLVFAPTAQTNRFVTQTILPDGRATGKGEMVIDGNKWIFNSTWNDGSTVTKYRTIDTFTSPTKIEFTQEESRGSSQWQAKDSGIQLRTSR